MALRKFIGFVASFAASIAFISNSTAAEALTKPSKISLDPNGVLVIDGKRVFPITLTIVPGPDAKAPTGKHAYAEFVDGGVSFIRTGKPDWNDETTRLEQLTQRAAAKYGLRCCPWLGWDLANFDPGDKKKEAELKRVIDLFKTSPGMGMWKGADEPAWGNMHDAKKSTPEQVAHVAKLIHQHDPNHPIWLVQAPRGTVPMLKRYNAGWDVGGIDIYPVSYPPGVHSEEKNNELSMVGDFTRMMREVAGEKPFWMTLQIAFSGTAKPGRTLRMPTFPEQRFMAYEAIINGARGLVYFGGGIEVTLNERDKPYGWNWTYWNKVMLPLLEEVGPKSPIVPALIAPDSRIKLTVVPVKAEKRKRQTKAEEQTKNGKEAEEPAEFVQDETPTAAAAAKALEFRVREVGDDVYVLACKKEGPTIRVQFSGLPKELNAGAVVFEEPRKVEAEGGSFTDWFGPFDVHVYKFSRK
jgi:hypothetical protein